MSAATGTGLIPSGALRIFVYNCDMSDSSDHVDHRDRSGQVVEVIGLPDWEPGWEASTRDERDDEAMPWVYPIRFSDGHIGGAFEDEIDMPAIAVPRLNTAPPRGES